MRDYAQRNPLLTHGEATPSYGGFAGATRPASVPSARRWVITSTLEDNTTGRCLAETTTVQWEVINHPMDEQPAGWSRQTRAAMIAAVVVLSLLLLACGIALGATTKMSMRTRPLHD